MLFRTGTSNCQEGFFLRGLWRGDSNNVGSIEWGKCCKPSHHPYNWGGCYDEDVSNTFNKAGLSECKEAGHFIAGFQTQDSGGKLSSIKKLNVAVWRTVSFCEKLTLVPTYNPNTNILQIKRATCLGSMIFLTIEIDQLKSLDELKQRVMDATMFHNGQLASMMGFAWSGGCWSVYAGEDFRRNGDSWESTYRSDRCLGGGPKKDVRLKITYGDFAYTMKDVTFGESIKQSIPVDREGELLNSPDYSFHKVASNGKENAGETGVTVAMRVASTLRNVKRTSWDRQFGIEVGTEYEPPSATGGVGFSAKASLSYEWGGDKEDVTVDQDWHILTYNEKKELPGKTFAEWHAFKKPQEVIIPYTATVLATFTVEFEGYMIWGGGYNGNHPNFHQEQRGSEDRNNMKWKFGSAHKPFYEDLKDQIEQNLYPWQWHAMKQQYPHAQYYIDQLLNKDLYAFTMEGQFEESTENEIKSYWYPSKPIDQMGDALANLTAQADQAMKNPKFPRIRPEAPKVKTIDNSKEMNAPPARQFNDDDVGEPDKDGGETEWFPPIKPPAPEVETIDNSKELKPPPAKQYIE
ncbi:hypothetical protein OS493_034737 [Desmophyllum pertusum]|uniref:Aerolysin-like C-terminal domain-containing protein n=1 Tax=Desmophyllum pertusum TaxID=174260 RepID=A0A9X0CNN1_9CNID|nr:hypothetical protein OS493_034737 [Desmophyllum pertusum]